MPNLKTTFQQLLSRYTTDEFLITLFWQEIEKAYNSKSRHYHNLAHLENMIAELEQVKTNINDYDAVLFSVFYHDIVYKSTAKDNEEKSAEKAKTIMERIGINPEQVAIVYHQILATKKHEKSEEADTNYLLDADMAILGQDWETYETYLKQVRKEYAIYPDFLYHPGRKKVLQHFLEQEELFKTTFFRTKYENQARENIQKEIRLL